VAQALAGRDETQQRVDRAPSTPLERALTALVSDVLGRSDFGANDDFFALGGDSVQATTLVAAVREWLDTPTVMLSDVFATRTVAALADRLCAREPDSNRLEQVAEMYLEVSSMDDAELSAQLDASVRL
jgi:mycobactin phenyloxazoline synthetase